MTYTCSTPYGNRWKVEHFAYNSHVKVLNAYGSQWCSYSIVWSNCSIVSLAKTKTGIPMRARSLWIENDHADGYDITLP